MKMRYVLGAVVSLTLISAAEAPSNFRTYYGGIRVDSDPRLLAAYDRALAYCMPEASTPPRGTPHIDSLYYTAALRNCLYRYGYTDRGAYSYPTTSIMFAY